MGFGFSSYKIKNDTQFAQAVKRMTAVTDNLKEPFELIGLDFLRSRKAIFKLKSAGQYPDLKSKTKDSKRRQVGFVYPILRLTGRLEKSVTQKGGKGNIFRNDGKSLHVGTSVQSDDGFPYPQMHQEGLGNMPLRKYLFIGPEAPKFAQGNDLKGFPERMLNTLNSFVLKEMGASVRVATGVAPVIEVDDKGITLPTSGDIK